MTIYQWCKEHGWLLGEARSFKASGTHIQATRLDGQKGDLWSNNSIDWQFTYDAKDSAGRRISRTQCISLFERDDERRGV